jgi:hypothetical protein
MILLLELILLVQKWLVDLVVVVDQVQVVVLVHQQ